MRAGGFLPMDLRTYVNVSKAIVKVTLKLYATYGYHNQSLVLVAVLIRYSNQNGYIPHN